jgi:uncharacterized membrane protein
VARTKLNERQLEVLRRICHGQMPITSDDSDLTATVYALRNRGLVTTTRADGRWSAAPTEAGHRNLAQTDATLAPRPSTCTSPTPHRTSGPTGAAPCMPHAQTTWSPTATISSTPDATKAT